MEAGGREEEHREARENGRGKEDSHAAMVHLQVPPDVPTRWLHQLGSGMPARDGGG